MAQSCLWIVAFPFSAFLIQAWIGKKLPRHGDFISVIAIAGSLALATPIFIQMLSTGNLYDTLQLKWIALPGVPSAGLKGAQGYELVIGVLVNNLTAIMLFMVTLCSTLIHLFSVGYMHGEDRYHLFFAYISLFSAAMLGLVISDNLLTFFICWELMGLCSYLLIGFYYKKPSAINASIKAFMTTRVGDTCFFMGICGVYYLFGTTNFMEIYGAVKNNVGHDVLILGLPAYTFIGLMIMMGTIGKSAQFPLHIWLPDAMEGPTPVSALIHAATMVAAGVFLLIRTYPLLEASHGVLTIIAYVGVITAFLASLIAIVQTDIKKVLAYSTISQLGFMVLGVGVGAFGAAFMHLVTHACFKACLFLCSGSVIHAVHTQDMREMGGLRTKMPWTFACMLIATLAISGLPFFSGFVSKDRVLAGALAFGMEHAHHMLIPILGFVTAGITAFYMFRLIYMTFFGAARDEHKHHHAHEQPLIMVFPLVVLAACSLSLWFSGPTGLDLVDSVLPVKWFEHSVEASQVAMGIGAHHGNEEIHHTAHNLALILSLLLAGGGILLSSLVYLRRIISPDTLKRLFGPMHHILWHKYFFDELYVGFFIKKVLLSWNRMLAAFDNRVVDAIFVDGWSKVVMVLRTVVGKFDEIFVDRLFVDGAGDMVTVSGWVVRRFQTGRVQQYLIFSLLALGVVFWALK